MIDVEKLNKEFLGALETSHYATNSKKALRYMMRRMMRDLDGTDLPDSKQVLQYRLALGNGTLNLFDTNWKMFQETETGRDLPDLHRRTAVIFPHPLYADVMHLGATYGNERVAELTWGDVKWGADQEDYTRKAMARAFLWFMPVGSVPNEDTPILVKDSLGAPMRLWQVEHIINSGAAYGSKQTRRYANKTAELMSLVIALASVRRTSPETLRHLCARVGAINSYAKQFNFRLAKKDVEATTTLAELCEVVGGFPIDPEPFESPYW